MESVTTAFDLMKLELEAAVEDLNTRGATYFRNSNYKEAKNLTDRGLELRAFCGRVEELAEEWSKFFAEEPSSEPSEIEQQTARKILASSKASSTRLLVSFPDGSKIAEKTAAQTLANAIERIGFERIENLGILVNRENIVSRSQSNRYNDVQIGSYFVKTHCSTEQKRKNLEQISKLLNLNLEVTII